MERLNSSPVIDNRSEFRAGAGGNRWLTWENAGKAWTILTAPFEIYMVGHGLATGNLMEAGIGAGLLVGDVLIWKFLNRNKNQMREQMSEVSPAELVDFRGSQRMGATTGRMVYAAA